MQHALRAYTPEDAKALKATVSTFPISDYDLEETLTSAGIGEAVITVMNEKGAPTPVALTRLRAPESVMGPSTDALIASTVAGSALLAQVRYGGGQRLRLREDHRQGCGPDRRARRPGSRPACAGGAARRGGIARMPTSTPRPGGSRKRSWADPAAGPHRRRTRPGAGRTAPRTGTAGVQAGMAGDLAGALGGALGGGLKSMARSLGTQLGRELLRGVFGTASQRRALG